MYNYNWLLTFLNVFQLMWLNWFNCDFALVLNTSSKIDTRMPTKKKQHGKYLAKPGIEHELVRPK